MRLLHLAWRNVLRNIRRSVITVTAITIGLAALIFVWGFIDGINEQTIDNNTAYLTGHLKMLFVPDQLDQLRIIGIHRLLNLAVL